MVDVLRASMKYIAFCLIYLWMMPSPALAAQVCVTIDSLAWTREQQNLVATASYHLAFSSGQNTVPTVTGDQICYNDPTFDVPSTVTTASVLSKIDAILAQRSVDLANAAVKQQAFADEVTGVTGNDLCSAELSEIEIRIDNRVAALQAQLDATTTATEVKAHIRNQLYPALGTVFKRIAKCLRARAGSGQ